MSDAGHGHLPPRIPLAQPVTDPEGPTPLPRVPLAQPIADPEGPAPLPMPPSPRPAPPELPERLPLPLPDRLCLVGLKQGCYRITYTPAGSLRVYRGTLRLDRGSGPAIISGDLYAFWHDARSGPFPALSGSQMSIPVYPRRRYYSYLKCTGIQRAPLFTRGECWVALNLDEYVYTQPPAGSFDGSFPVRPSRSVRVVLSPTPPPAGFTGDYFAGRLYEGGVDKGAFAMGWVSPFYRRATLEIDVMEGAVAPQPVAEGGLTHSFASLFATAGWDLKVIYNQAAIPNTYTTLLPGGARSVDWTNSQLHQAMTEHRARVNLDNAWWLHLLVVPENMGSGRGRMYDILGAPREGVASFSDDGYPASESSHFGAAAGQLQRDVPRAFLRSACHEVGHGFNQVHQNATGAGEPGNDATVMTTTPEVADFLFARGGPPFPDGIELRFNAHVRHHLIHFPDPAVRPGGMSFGAGHSFAVPQADGEPEWLDAADMELRLPLPGHRIKLGQPLYLPMELVNRSDRPLPAPVDISPERRNTRISVTNPSGITREMPSFVIATDPQRVAELAPGAAVRAQTRLFWSAKGFAFREPGMHTVTVEVFWNWAGVALGVRNQVEVFVDYPVTEADNEVACHLMHAEVGKIVALGGGAHLQEGMARIREMLQAFPAHGACHSLGELLGGAAGPGEGHGEGHGPGEGHGHGAGHGHSEGHGHG